MCEYLRYASTLFRNVSLANSLENYQPIHMHRRQRLFPFLFRFERENRGPVNRL